MIASFWNFGKIINGQMPSQFYFDFIMMNRVDRWNTAKKIMQVSTQT